jgi:ADP-heptose:LPS heptosyltransferase
MIIDIVMFRTMGDVLMSTPIISAVRKLYPDATIRFHTLDQYKDLVNKNKDLSMVVSYPQESYMAIHKFCKENPGDVLMPLGMANHYDTCWHHNDESKNLHMIDFYASRAGLQTPLVDKHIRYQCSDEDIKVANTIPDIPGPDQYVVMHTTTLLETKDWPVQYFNHLAQMIQDKYNLPVVQIGGGKDHLINCKIQLAGKLTLGQTAAVINNCKFYVGVDSGNAYLAEALNKHTFIVMGATMAKAQSQGQTGPFVGPVGPTVHYIEPVRPENPNCKPVSCYNHCVIKTPCIDTIKPDDVFGQIETLIQ